MGRNDGASGKRRRSTPSKGGKRADMDGPKTDEGLWYEREAEAGPSTSTSSWSRSGVGRPAPAPAPPSSSRSFERAGSHRGGDRARAARDAEEEEDNRGWWERPEERSLQAYAPRALDPWQEERLQLAFATGRRKANIQDLARELELDRAVVIAWFKEFALRPQSEREGIMTARRGEDEARRAEQASRDAAEAATGQAKEDARIAAAAQPGQEAPVGFIPFFTRKELGAGKQKRISGEVLRTLEAIYDRTPFPSGDVVRGLYELHRLNRDVATEWFAQRRAADGITSSTQKRTMRPSLRVKDRELEGAFDGPEEAPVTNGSGGGGPPSSAGMLSILGAGAPAAPQKPSEPTVVTLSRREMAALRSSLPSPNKYKGREMADKMSVKTGADGKSTQINDVQFVQEAVAPGAVRERVRAAWRFRAAEAGAAGAGPAAGQRLRLRTRGGSAAEARSSSDGSDGDE